jgi:hypothetical protein
MLNITCHIVIFSILVLSLHFDEFEDFLWKKKLMKKYKGKVCF